MRKVLAASNQDLPKAHEPNLDDIIRNEKKARKAAEKSTEANRSASQSREGARGATSSEHHARFAAPAHPEASMKPLPQSWILRRRQDAKKANMNKARTKRTTPVIAANLVDQIDDCVPGVHREFKEIWEDLQLQVEIPPLPGDPAALRAAAKIAGRAAAGTATTALSVPGVLMPRRVAAPDSNKSPAPPHTLPPHAVIDEDLANLPNAVSEDVI